MVHIPVRQLAQNKLLRRTFLSFTLGVTITFLPIFAAPRFIDFESPNPIYMTVLGHFLYWPLSALNLGGIDCVGPDKVAGTMGSVEIALAIDILVYSAVCFLMLSWPKRLDRAS